MAAKIIPAVDPPEATPMRERLIVALDVSSAQAARELVSTIGAAAGIYKVGLQLFAAEGPGLVREFVNSGLKIFLDLKLHDIPHTVSRAVKAAADLGVTMLTVHSSAGSAVLRAAVEAAGGKLAILAVTVLTSFSDEDLDETGVSDPVASQVLRLAALARGAGCWGIVTSPRETASIRTFMGEGFAIVNPGVRPAGAGKDDQERTATPAEAIRAGATYIVVGRPITQSTDPAGRAREIILEMEQGQSSGVR